MSARSSDPAAPPAAAGATPVLPPPPARSAALRLTAWTATTAAGDGREALAGTLREGRSALRPQDFCDGARGHIGRIDGLEDAPLPAPWARWDCRNNRLAWRALQADGLPEAIAAARRRHGAARIAVLVGTSTSSIGASEDAYASLDADGRFPAPLRRPEVHAPHSLGGFVARATGLEGPSMTVATACSSSARVFAQAERMIRLGLVDAALVGGVDSLCRSVLHGFAALGLVGDDACRPFETGRAGVSLAEAGGFALLERADPALADRDDAPWLVGYGESSDAHHMSAPHPEGLGARLAMRDALARAGRDASSVDYLNLHGTATPRNDEVEAAVVGSMFGAPTRVGSTKACTGHALGAAGIVEAVVACLALRDGFVPGPSTGGRPPQVDAALDARFRELLVRQVETRPVRVAMSNSFGFGGNNAALVFAGPGGRR